MIQVIPLFLIISLEFEFLIDLMQKFKNQLYHIFINSIQEYYIMRQHLTDLILCQK